jgi:predicted esterase
MPVVRQIRVHRSARIYVGGTPGKRTRELWVCCHGYGQLALSFANALEALADDARVIVAPEALSRFYLDDPAKRHGPDSPVGASWMTREDREREIADYVEYLDLVASTVSKDCGGGDPRLVALGFSQGVATACRWTALGRARVRHLVMWGGTVPPDLPADRGDQVFRGASLIMVAGRQDQLLPVHAMDREHRALAGRGLTAELMIHEGGHSLNTETLRRVAAAISSAA